MPQARSGGLRGPAWGRLGKLPEEVTPGLHLKKKHEALQAGRGWCRRPVPRGGPATWASNPRQWGGPPSSAEFINPETRQQLDSRRFPYGQNSPGDSRLLLLDGRPVPRSEQLRDGSAWGWGAPPTKGRRSPGRWPGPRQRFVQSSLARSGFQARGEVGSARHHLRKDLGARSGPRRPQAPR